MVDKTEPKTNGPSKSFMTAGPTLHYSHDNVRRYWALVVTVYLCSCLLWSKILSGTALSINFSQVFEPSSWGLSHFITSPLSIYEYPSQILVLGILMGALTIIPILVSQLMSFRYSWPMMLGAFFVARLPILGAAIFISCLAVACRPLRFRSRFIAIVLCTAPEILYWSIFGGTQNVDPVKWGFSFSPWICAWLTCLWMSGAVLAVGHYTRYKPGLIWSIGAIALCLGLALFSWNIGFSELDYQLYIAKNNPEEVREFHDHSLTEAIDKAMEDDSTRSFLTGLFYPTEPIMLRENLKKDVQLQLTYDRWPNWFKVPPELNYQAKRQWLLAQYDIFINKRPTSDRMPIALYYKAILNEFAVDIQAVTESETLHFYSNYPQRENLPIWYKLYKEFSQSPEAIEARWRIGMHIAAQGEFEKVREQCDVSLVKLQSIEGNSETGGIFFTAFKKPARTAMTPRKLHTLGRKINELQSLINGQNHTDSPESKKRLSRFIILNPYRRDYAERLDNLLAETKDDDPLRDNILLAKAMLTKDPLLRQEQLKNLSKEYLNKDGGIRSLYELGLLKVNIWKSTPESGQVKNQYLTEAREILGGFVSLYPESIFSKDAQMTLDSLPAVE